MNKDLRLAIEVSGGLGNQLFQLAALQCFSRDYNRIPVVNVSKISRASTPREFGVPGPLLKILFSNIPEF